VVTPHRIVVGAHYGWRDWLAQRVTAVVMAVYTVLLLGLLLWFGGLDYAAWKSVFETTPFASQRSCSWWPCSGTRGSACATS
jgi:succinate dehydrogenase hydrophobic anchor subunit